MAAGMPGSGTTTAGSSGTTNNAKYGSQEYYNNAMAARPQGANTYHPYGEYYNDGYVRPSNADLAAERARTSSRSGRSGRSYDGLGYDGWYDLMSSPETTTEEPAEPPEPVDTSAVRNDLLNAEQNGAATQSLLNNAGYNFPQQNGLNVPDQVALPDRVALPTDVALPNYVENPNVALPNNIALPDNVDLPNRLDLPNRVDLPGMLDFNKAMNEANVNIGRINNVDVDREAAMLQQINDAQKQQAVLNSENTVNKGTANLQRSLQDAQEQFNAQQRQIDIDEQRAKDNQALYAEARGDRGGIGQAQYNTIQNTAATNRLTVQKEQSKLATDTARQIADLRSQGEFEKANQLLSITQNHLSELMDLYTWAKEANIGIDEFNLNVAQWEQNYKMNLINAQLQTQNANLNVANAMMNQENAQFNAAYQQENSLYNARWNQAQQLFQDAYQQENSQYNARWNQAQQLWQNQYNQENSLYNARWNQAQQLFNAAYNQENSQFEARRAATNDYFNNQLNAANYGINASRAALEAQLDAANATGTFTDGTATYAAQQNARQILAASGQALLEHGIVPTAEQLAAMGMTAEQSGALTNVLPMDMAGLSYYPTVLGDRYISATSDPYGMFGPYGGDSNYYFPGGSSSLLEMLSPGSTNSATSVYQNAVKPYTQSSGTSGWTGSGPRGEGRAFGY